MLAQTLPRNAASEQGETPIVRYVATTTRPLTEFGEELMDLIQTAGYERVHAFARVVGIHHVNLGKWMDGSATPSVEGLRRVAPHLGVRLGDLMVKAGLATREELGMVGTPPAPTPPLPPVIRSILSRLASPRYKQKHKDDLLYFVQDDVDRWDAFMADIEEERAEARRGRR